MSSSLEDSVIEKHKLTDLEVILIVKEWYENYEGIFQDEDGCDLEEICDIYLY